MTSAHICALIRLGWGTTTSARGESTAAPANREEITQEKRTANTEDTMVVYDPSLMTDMYEYTMLDATLQDGTANRPCVFEVFTRHLPEGRRYGVVAGM